MTLYILAKSSVYHLDASSWSEVMSPMLLLLLTSNLLNIYIFLFLFYLALTTALLSFKSIFSSLGSCEDPLELWSDLVNNSSSLHNANKIEKLYLLLTLQNPESVAASIADSLALAQSSGVVW